MPEQWWVPIPGVDPARVRPQHVHAAVSGWFDRDENEHRAQHKPYTVSALAGDDDGGTGVQVTVLTSDARDRLLTACADRAVLRLGNQVRRVGRPTCMHRRSWADLASSPARCWRLELLTPATFKNGDRCAPLPNVNGILRSLARTWAMYADVPCPDWQPHGSEMWVSDLDLRNVLLKLPTGRRDRATQITISAAVGWFVLRSASPQAGAVAGPLVESAAFAGLGAMTRKGLGATAVTALNRDGTPVPVQSHGAGHDPIDPGAPVGQAG